MSSAGKKLMGAVGLFLVGVYFRDRVVPVSWLLVTILLALDTAGPAWYRPPSWLRRPVLGLVASVVWGLSAVVYPDWGFGVLLCAIAAGIVIHDAHERGDLRSWPRIVGGLRATARTLRDEMRTPPGEGEPGSDVLSPQAAITRKWARIGLAVCFASLFMTWVPWRDNGYISWQRTGTIYEDYSGRVVEDRTYSTPVWQSSISYSRNGLGVGLGPVVFLVAGGGLVVLFSRIGLRERRRDMVFKVCLPVLLLALHANGYAGDALGWWVFLVGLGIFSAAAWRHFVGERALRTAPV